MRPVSARWNETIPFTHGIATSVRAEYKTEYSVPVPLLTGVITYDLTAVGRRRCTIQVPLYGPDGFRWDPGNNSKHPLATYGQRLHIETGIAYADGTTELMDHGYYLIYTVNADDAAGVVTVTAMDLMQLWQDSPIVNEAGTVAFPASPTMKYLTTRLSYVALQNTTLNDPTILPVVYNANLVDMTPSSRPEMADGADRTQVLQQLLTAWGASAAVNDAAQLEFYDPPNAASSIPDIELTGDTTTSTLTSRGREQSRRRMYNAVKVISRSPSTGAVLATAKAQRDSGVLGVYGPFGWITRRFETNMIPIGSFMQRAANRLLAEGTLYTRTETVSCVPNAALELEDTARVKTSRGDTFTGLVTAIVLPLTVGSNSGVMNVTVTNEQEDA